MSGLTITSPQAGSTVGPLEPILGEGATADADVNLIWHETTISTVAADADGNFAFSGDTPMALGEVTLTVECDGETSDPVTFTVEEAEPVPSPDEAGGYMPPDPPTVYEDIAAATSDPSVASGQPPAPAMATTNAYEQGGLPMSPREPYPTGGAVERTYAQINSGRR